MDVRPQRRAPSLPEAWSEFTDDPPADSTTSTAAADEPSDDEIAAQVAERIDELGLRDCVELADDVLVVLDTQFDSTTIVAADFATADIDGVAVTVAVLLLADDQVAALVIDQATCALAAQPLE